MALLGMILSVLGLVLVLAAGIVLLRYIFIPEEELTRLAALPLEASTGHTTGAQSRRRLSIAVTDIAQLNEYRDQFIAARRVERQIGRWGFGLLIAGSLLQIFGVIVSFYGAKT
jgi:hypothetical protein